MIIMCAILCTLILGASIVVAAWVMSMGSSANVVGQWMSSLFNKEEFKK